MLITRYGIVLIFLILFNGSCYSQGEAPEKKASQGFSKRDLVGKWLSPNAEMVMIFEDTLTVHIKVDGNAALNNTPLGYSIDSIQNHSLLLLRYPNGFTMKMILWFRSKDEIGLFLVEAMNYKDPLKDLPEEGSRKIMIMKRSKNSL